MKSISKPRRFRHHRSGDVNVSVSEKSTGNVMLGAGFSSSEGLVLRVRLSQSNVFGTGNRLSVQVNSGSVNTVYALSFTNPYFTIDGISLGTILPARRRFGRTRRCRRIPNLDRGCGCAV